MEGWSRRNNIHIYSVPEGIEGSSVPDFVEQLLKSELALTVDNRLQIQCAHRTLARKPEGNQPPRSIVVNSLEFNTKESVLKKAWGKKIMIEGRCLSFDHDYATEVIQKCKAHTGIKRLLKEKGIRFQNHLDKMRIHWDSGTRTYESAQEECSGAEEEGYSVTRRQCRGLRPGERVASSGLDMAASQGEEHRCCAPREGKIRGV